tara:strand:- start:8318 stop:8860 length:543 start_codon:yes stop_codon:yes gene_type:complete
MRKTVTSLLSTALFFAAMTDSSPTYAAGLRYGCDTATGRYSPVDIPLTASQLTFSGTMRPALFRYDPKWIPTAFVRINDSNKQSITIRLVAKNSKASAADATVVVQDGEDRKTAVVGAIPLDKAMRFSISYGENDDIAIVVNGKKTSLSNKLDDDITLSLVCSTGDFVFDEIAWSTSPTE